MKSNVLEVSILYNDLPLERSLQDPLLSSFTAVCFM